MFVFNFGLFFALLIVVFLLFGFIYGCTKDLSPTFLRNTIIVLILVAFFASFLVKEKEQQEEDFYYLGAEILSIEGNEKGYLINFVPVDNPDYKNIKYAFIATNKLNIDVPYLLTMDNKGTENIQDDEIVVVWEWVA